MATDPWGIDDGYHNVAGEWCQLPPQSHAALRAAMRTGSEVPPEPPPLWFVRAGSAPPLQRRCDLLLEDGTQVAAVSALPPDLPLGWHRLRPVGEDGPETTVAVCPDRAHLPADLRAWLWSAQLYATRSSRSWGIGDFGDLADLCRFGRRTGAAMIGVNPLFDAATEPRCQASPYFPSTRRWLHPIWLRIEEVPGAAEVEELAALAAEARALNESRRIDREAVWQRKRSALDLLWRRFRASGEPGGFQSWRIRQGPALEEHARYRALAEVHGSDWRSWPAELRDPSSGAVARAARDLDDQVAFWAWLQWLLDSQLAAASAELPLLADLPVGCDPGGSDGWRWQRLLADGAHAGAPPDPLGPLGQDWGVVPFIPWAIRAAHYQPLAEIVRAACTHAAALRIDHVMGLFRLFWVPGGGSPADGGYVRFPGTELFDVVTMEATRAGTVLVGEDLGTVEPWVREVMAERAVLGTRLVWFEDQPPAALPELCMASISTHDLPTVAGLWTGADAEDARAAGIPVDDTEVAALRRRLAAAAGVPDDPTAPAREVIAGATAALGRSPARLVSLSLDDALCVAERPNVPSTTEERRQNWSLALPVPLERFDREPLVERCAQSLAQTRPHPRHDP